MSDLGFLNQTFDDRDTNSLRYQGFWFHTGFWNATTVGESGTLTSSNDPNANITFTFPVPARAFYYYGIKRSQGGIYEICVDCDPRNENWVPIDVLNTTVNGQNPPAILFSQTFKNPAVHEIIIRNSNDTRVHTGGNSQITIDRIEIEVVNLNAPTITVTTANGAQTSPGSTTNGAASSPKANGAPIGGIIGAALGSLALICFLVLFCLWWIRWRRRRVQDKFDVEQLATPDPIKIQPPPAVMSQTENSIRPLYTVIPPQKGSSGTNRVNPPLGLQNYSSSDLTSPSMYNTTLSSSNALSLGGSAPRRERDGGPLPMRVVEDEDTEALPPDYVQIFGQPRRGLTVTRATAPSSVSSPSGYTSS